MSLSPPVAAATAPLPEIVDLRDPVDRINRLASGQLIEEPTAAGGVVVARCLVGSVDTIVFATDSREQGGALGLEGCQHIVSAYDRAMFARLPIVGIWHSGGARLTEGAESLHGVGMVFAAMTRASGTIPQISLVLGAAAGGAAYGPALTDIVVLGPAARVFVTGPDIVNRVTGEDVDAETLGGPAVHSRQSGLAHVHASTDDEAYSTVARVVGLLRSAATKVPEIQAPDPSRHLPNNPRRAYDVRPLVVDLLDDDLLELQSHWAPNVVVGLGRLAGRSVGVIANNPIRLGGCLNSEASEKAARFVRLCDSFGIPLIVIVDVPGYLPGTKQETNGIIRRGAKLLHAFAAASVPRITVITGKAYGGAYIAMNSKSLGAQDVFAWPRATVDVMSSEAAVRITRKRELANLGPDQETAAVSAFASEHEETTGGLQRAVTAGAVSQIIDPVDTRHALIHAFAHAPTVPSAQKNIPL